MSQTIITAGDASAGLVQSAGNDGTLVLQTGAAGAKVNAISLAADGTPTFLKVPANAAVQSMVRLNTANGYGSTNTKIRRFTNVITNQGSDITYADSATLGASFTINANGVYAISFTDQYGAADLTIITLNDSAPAATSVIGDILAGDYSGTLSAPQNAFWCGYLPAGSVIRARSDAGNAAGSATKFTQFTITRVA
jgi:hypothetical protein